ncbi:hypothetical protein LQL77_31340 [Rhodococcus cerastii]|nr:hypothetical protein [Rhodococcus cerastii]
MKVRTIGKPADVSTTPITDTATPKVVRAIDFQFGSTVTGRTFTIASTTDDTVPRHSATTWTSTGFERAPLRPELLDPAMIPARYRRAVRRVPLGETSTPTRTTPPDAASSPPRHRPASQLTSRALT